MCLDQQRISENTMKQRVASCLDGVPNGTPLWALFSPSLSSLCNKMQEEAEKKKKLRAYPQLYLSATKHEIGFLDVLWNVQNEALLGRSPESNFRDGVLKPGLKPDITLYLEPQISFHGVPLPTCIIAVKRLFTPIHERGFRQKTEI